MHLEHEEPRRSLSHLCRADRAFVSTSQAASLYVRARGITMPHQNFVLGHPMPIETLCIPVSIIPHGYILGVPPQPGLWQYLSIDQVPRQPRIRCQCNSCLALKRKTALLCDGHLRGSIAMFLSDP